MELVEVKGGDLQVLLLDFYWNFWPECKKLHVVRELFGHELRLVVLEFIM